MADTITAKVFRYDPSVDEAPYYRIYEVPFDDDGCGIMTGLQVLQYINDEIEPIVVDYNCRGGLCGRCSMVIDGVPGLACHTGLTPGEHTFEPLGDLPVIKDLMVDRAPFMQKFTESKVARQTVNPIRGVVDMDYDLYWNTFERLNYCRECMCCYEVCPALVERNDWDFVGPGAMMQIAYRALDPQDEADRVGQAVFSGLWRCDLCGKCSTVCTAQIDHVGLMAKLQAMAEERGLKPTDSEALPSYREESGEQVEAVLAYEGTDPEGIIAANCVSCHSAEELLALELDPEEAAMRVNGHAANSAALSEEQKAVLTEAFSG